MFNKFKNGTIVIVNGVGKVNGRVYQNVLATIICRDPWYLDYNIKLQDGTEDWIDDIYLSEANL